MNAAIDEFANKLIKTVRDATITSSEVLKNPWAGDPTRLKLNEFDPKIVKQILDLLVPAIIDDTIFHLMRAIDGGDIRLVYIADDGTKCELAEEGQKELAGWLLGEDGWIERYSSGPKND